MSYTSDDLVADIQRDAYLTAAQRNFTPAQMLTIADQELYDGLAPMLVSMSQGYFEENADSTTTANVASYDLNQFAMWNRLRRVDIIDSNIPFELLQITPEQVLDYDPSTTGRPRVFLFSNSQITLFPIPDRAYTLRQRIYRRPGRLVPVASAAQVLTAVASTVTYTGATPATFTATSIHDFYDGVSPFRRVDTSVTATGKPLATTQTFAAADVALLSAGDYVSLTGETVFPGIPIELHPHLKDLVIRSMDRTQGDQGQWQTQRAEILERARGTIIGTSNRSTGQPQRISIPAARVGTWRRWTRG